MKQWAHVTTSTRGHWVPGDARGFRSRGTRIISTGTYDNPPPSDEHAGLRRHARSIAAPVVKLTPEQRRAVGGAMLEKFHEMEVFVGALACAALHTHVLIRAGAADSKIIVGRAKQAASHRVRDEIPGRLWGGSSHPERIVSRERFWETVVYIAAHADDGAWVWIEPSVREGMGRQGDGWPAA